MAILGSKKFCMRATQKCLKVSKIWWYFAAIFFKSLLQVQANSDWSHEPKKYVLQGVLGYLGLTGEKEVRDKQNRDRQWGKSLPNSIILELYRKSYLACIDGTQSNHLKDIVTTTLEFYSEAAESIKVP